MRRTALLLCRHRIYSACFHKHIANQHRISSQGKRSLSRCCSFYLPARDDVHTQEEVLRRSFLATIGGHGQPIFHNFSTCASNHLKVSTFPMKQAHDIEWLSRTSSELARIDSDQKHSEVETIKNGGDVLSSKHAMAMKAWALHPSEHAATMTEILLNSLMERCKDVIEDRAEEVGLALVALHNMAIHAWGTSGVEGNAQEAEVILLRMIEMSSTTEAVDGVHIGNNLYTYIRPDVISFNSIIDAWSKSGESFAASRAEEVFSLMKADESGVQPDNITYNSLISAWSKIKSAKSPERVMSLLNEMEVLDEAGHDNVRPNTITYNAILSALAKAKRKDSGKQAEALLSRMEELSQSDDKVVVPDTLSYSATINAWAKSGEIGGALRAEDILRRMQELHENGNMNVKPNTICFNSVINAWAYSKLKGNAEKAEELLNLMITLHSSGSPDIVPDKVSFHQVMLAHARSGSPSASQKVRELLNQMEENYARGNTSAKPDAYSYGTLISTLLRSRQYDAARKAQHVLDHMEKMYNAGDNEMKPDRIAYNSTLRMWAKSTERKAYSKADELVARMEELSKTDQRSGLKPDTLTYSTLIDIWAKSRRDDAGIQAESILDKIEILHGDGAKKVVPATHAYNAAINAWASINTVKKENAQRAHALLKRMEQLSESGVTGVQPDVVSYNSVIKACARTGNAKVAQDLLDYMEKCYVEGNKEIQPDAYTYNCVMNAWAKCGSSEEGARHAQNLLQRMADKVQTGPDSISFNTVLNAWSNVGGKIAAQRAEEVLRLMEKVTGMESGVIVDRKSYTSVIKCWQRSGLDDVSHEVIDLMNRMMEQYKQGNTSAIPDVVTYNAALQAFTSTKGGSDDKRHAFQLAQVIFKDMEEAPNISPDKLTYKLMMEACKILVESLNDREKMANNFFQQCCVDGRLDENILKAFQVAAPNAYGAEIGQKKLSDLPAEWVRNVKRWAPSKGRSNYRSYNTSNYRTKRGNARKTGQRHNNK